eukprot:4868322-Lingulodinium_polyedra.AAC.1
MPIAAKGWPPVGQTWCVVTEHQRKLRKRKGRLPRPWRSPSWQEEPGVGPGALQRAERRHRPARGVELL